MKGEGGRGKGEHPAALLERVFSHIAATRMAGLPILNPALRVEAVGFREWEGRWVGVLVTPWSLNLLVLAGAEATLPALAPDEKMTWGFPSGAYEFMGFDEPALGACHVCPLLSPLPEFASQDDAVAAAHAVMEDLYKPVAADPERAAELAGMIEDARLRGDSLARQEISRRDFLRMPFLGG